MYNRVKVNTADPNYVTNMIKMTSDKYANQIENEFVLGRTIYMLMGGGVQT